MEEKVNKIEVLLKKLSDLRKKPLLILDIETSLRSAVLLEQELRGKSFQELDVVLHTGGGLIEPAFNIVKLLRKHAKKVNIIVPHYAKSAGTLVCCGADKLLLGQLAELGPLDVQIPEVEDGDGRTYKSALNGFKALEQIQRHALENLDIATKLIIDRTNGIKVYEAIKLGIEFSGHTSGCLYNQLNPKTIGEYARALEIGLRYAIMILTRYMGWGPDKALAAARELVFNYPSHSFIIDVEELKRLGFPAEEVDNTISDTVYDLKLSLLQKEAQGSSMIKLFELPTPKPETKKTTEAPKKANTKK